MPVETGSFQKESGLNEDNSVGTRKRSGNLSIQPRRGIEQNVLDTLVGRGALGKSDLDAAIEASKDGDNHLEDVLLDRFHIPKHELGLALSDYYQCPYLPYDERTSIEADLLKTLNVDYLRHSLWIPISRRGALIDILTADPNDPDKHWDVRRAFPGSTIRYVVGLRRDIRLFLTQATGHGKGSPIGSLKSDLVQDISNDCSAEAIGCEVDENDSGIVRLTNYIIAEADRLNASDVHIEPYADRKDTAVRLRVDGTCYTHMKFPALYRHGVVSRIKIMANLDIAERRKPQDGKIRFRLDRNREIELRVATLPTAGGDEDVVLRLLTAKEPMPLDTMDFSPVAIQTLRNLSEKPHGLILCVGPTGSGKTTTLHALLNHINTDERKIWTAEDPIEITQDGLRQVQVHPKIGLTFAAAMRAFLRADPDVIMIGEMRDRETADIAIEASLTGHLVLSTLHTNSAAETVVRLLDLGCDPFNFADAMLGILAQRLCKKICQYCAESYHPSRSEYDDLLQGYGHESWKLLGVDYHDGWTLRRGRGCETCNRTGFKGRVPIHELLVASGVVKQLIQAKARTREIHDKAIEEGMTTLLQDGIRKVLRGLTTYSQVRAVAMR